MGVVKRIGQAGGRVVGGFVVRSGPRASGSRLKTTEAKAAARARAESLRISVSFDGLSHVDAALDALPEAVRLRVLRRTMKKAAEPILHAARSKVSVDSGDLAAAIVIKPKRKRKRSTVLAVSVLPGADWFRGQTYYAGMIEFGWMKRAAYRASNGQWKSFRRGVGPSRPMEPRPFLRPALDETKAEVMARFREEIPKEVAKAAARLARAKLKSENATIERLDKRAIRRMDSSR